MSVEHLDDLRAATRHARERYQLYEAKAYGPRPTSPARLRELQRCYEQADARLRAAEAEAQRTGAAGDASVSGSLRGRSLRTSLNTDAHQRRYFCIASRKRARAASASARPDLVQLGRLVGTGSHGRSRGESRRAGPSVTRTTPPECCRPLAGENAGMGRHTAAVSDGVSGVPMGSSALEISGLTHRFGELEGSGGWAAEDRAL